MEGGTMLKDKTTGELAARLVEIATGETWGDGEVVTDVLHGYADPRYGAEDATIVLGNWNPKRYPREGDAPLSKVENLGPRLARALERVGAEVEWLDEWAQCSECYRAIRTEPDSYSWVPKYTWLGDDIVCGSCLLEDPAGSIDAGDYINNADKAITWAEGPTLAAMGWTQWAPGDPRQFQNGWHPGQDDNPAAILAEVLAADETAEVVFLIDATGQFDVRFSAYTRAREDDDAGPLRELDDIDD